MPKLYHCLRLSSLNISQHSHLQMLLEINRFDFLSLRSAHMLEKFLTIHHLDFSRTPQGLKFFEGTGLALFAFFTGRNFTAFRVMVRVKL